MSFEGNLDLYWKYEYKGSILKNNEIKTFVIKESDSILYELFSKLYESIILDLPYLHTSLNLDRCTTCNNNELVKNGVIEWHSDEGEYDSVSVLYIEKLDSSFKISFKRGRVQNMFYTYSVCFCMSGSRYDKFSYTFQNMYDVLKSIDFNQEKRHIILPEKS